MRFILKWNKILSTLCTMQIIYITLIRIRYAIYEVEGNNSNPVYSKDPNEQTLILLSALWDDTAALVFEDVWFLISTKGRGRSL